MALTDVCYYVWHYIYWVLTGPECSVCLLALNQVKTFIRESFCCPVLSL